MGDGWLRAELVRVVMFRCSQEQVMPASQTRAPRVRAAKKGAKQAVAGDSSDLRRSLLGGPNHGPATKAKNRSEVGRSFTRESES